MRLPCNLTSREVIAVALLLYDTILRVEDEYLNVWKPKVSLVKATYIAYRYLMVLGLILTLHGRNVVPVFLCALTLTNIEVSFPTSNFTDEWVSIFLIGSIRLLTVMHISKQQVISTVVFLTQVPQGVIERWYLRAS